MENKYLYNIFPEGEIYIQLRYFSPDPSTGECYEALVLRLNSDGSYNQQLEIYGQEIIAELRQWRACTEEKFDFALAKIIGPGTKKEWYEKYYGQWKDYFTARKDAVRATRLKNPPNNWHYYQILAQEYVNHHVQPKEDSLRLTAQGIEKASNPSLTDIFQRARQQATMDYVQERI
jgi:hypothetical protein